MEKVEMLFCSMHTNPHTSPINRVLPIFTISDDIPSLFSQSAWARIPRNLNLTIVFCIFIFPVFYEHQKQWDGQQGWLEIASVFHKGSFWNYWLIFWSVGRKPYKNRTSGLGAPGWRTSMVFDFFFFVVVLTLENWYCFPWKRMTKIV